MNNLLKYIIYILARCRVINNVTIAKLKYLYKFHKRLNLNNPKNINEKINWLKFYGDISKWVNLADKYKVREHIERAGFGNTLVKLYEKWDTLEQIDLNVLPNEFVMKSNNGCGDILICKDRSNLSKTQVISHFKRSFEKVYGLESAEPHYALIKPCIIVEELLDKDKQRIKSNSLIDYKVWCFNGKPHYIWVCCNRDKHGAEVMTYDLNWNAHPEYSIFNHHYRKGPIIPRPKTLDEMIHMAEVLSKTYPVVRVDLYEVDDKVYFGELTFTPLGGYIDFFNVDILNLMGDKIDLNYGRE